MTDSISFEDYLAAIRRADSASTPVCETLAALAQVVDEIAQRIALGTLAGRMGDITGTNSDGDVQKALDLFGHNKVTEALARAPVAELASEEAEEITVLDAKAPLAVAIDPVDGSSNIDTNLSIGTIFSIRPAGCPGLPELRSFGGTGMTQKAAGFAIYGPQTTLVLTLGTGVEIFTLDRRQAGFVRTRSGVRIPSGTHEFAINASNQRHWGPPVRAYIDDCREGSDGVRGTDFNMRWPACLVADAYRILVRGGIYLYPADRRPGYGSGRLRLVYEGAPIAMIMEQAGGRASTGRERILEVEAETLHQRVPLIFGAADEVERVDRLHCFPEQRTESPPLFATRGLMLGSGNA
jgi:fructose-1,6-bisphosphatase I